MLIDKATKAIAYGSTMLEKVYYGASYIWGKIKAQLVAMSGSRMELLNVAKESELVDFKLYGKSEQKQYLGTQLIDDRWYDVINVVFGTISVSDGITTITRSDASQESYTEYNNTGFPEYLRIYGAKGERFTFTYEALDSSRCFIFENGNTTNSKSKTTDIPGKYSLTLTLTDDGYVTFRIGLRADQGMIGRFKNLRINKGATDKGFEPYVGGAPSPSSDYPQGIKNVTQPSVSLSADGREPQTYQFPYTLHGIPVSSGGNYTDESGQQWIADYVDVEGKKLWRYVDYAMFDTTQSIYDRVDWLLTEPYYTALTDAEVAAFKQLKTIVPTTVVSNDAGAHMEAKYWCDLDSLEAQTTSLYNNDIKELIDL